MPRLTTFLIIVTTFMLGAALPTRAWMPRPPSSDPDWVIPPIADTAEEKISRHQMLADMLARHRDIADWRGETLRLHLRDGTTLAFDRNDDCDNGCESTLFLPFFLGVMEKRFALIQVTMWEALEYRLVDLETGSTVTTAYPPYFHPSGKLAVDLIASSYATAGNGFAILAIDAAGIRVVDYADWPREILKVDFEGWQDDTVRLNFIFRCPSNINLPTAGELVRSTGGDRWTLKLAEPKCP